MKALLLPVVVAASLVAAPTKVLWTDPGPIASRDLFWGIGSAERAPKPPFMFVSEDLSGTKPKMQVKDAAGVAWSVKLVPNRADGNEVHAEIAATRILSAFGYFVDENYYVASGRVEGATGLKRAAEVVSADGAFQTARFERRPDNAKVVGTWAIEANPFKGRRELAGLHALVMLVGAWDLIKENLVVLQVPSASLGSFEDRFVVSDLGSTFGRNRGGAGKVPTRWNIADYTASKFLTGVVQRKVQFHDPLTGNAPLAIPLDHARWFAGMASQLSDSQIHRAFEASGASPVEVDAYSAQVRRRIAEFTAAAGK